MKAWASLGSRASVGMTRSSQEMIVPSSGTKKRTSGFSRRTWKTSPFQAWTSRNSPEARPILYCSLSNLARFFFHSRRSVSASASSASLVELML